MDNLARLLLRFLLVPLGYFAAVIAGACVILIGEWRIGTLLETNRTEDAALGFVVAIVTTVTVLFVLMMLMWLVAAVGILFSEAFAIRSWMFHAGNGVVSALIGAQLFAPSRGDAAVAGDPFYTVAAGLAGGLVYWVVAGSTAGFFKPILRSGAELAGRLPPPGSHTPPAAPAAPPAPPAPPRLPQPPAQ
ncbi:hypothetical protein V5F49_05635 [Xanthobacter sp. V3C-3]|uniref:hypothetical protein n=1 Tax=Xanthobacter lutulentifluminis TaxID=3119935 RepID=UPI0037278ECE